MIIKYKLKLKKIYINENRKCLMAIIQYYGITFQ